MMQEIIDNIVKFAVSNLQSYGIVFGCILILLESIIPALPLGVFIALNMIAFGNVIGFVLSWFFTMLGCMISYMLFKKISGKKLEKVYKKYPKLGNFKSKIKNMKFSTFVLIVALPFSPAFLINIAAGLTRMNFKKFLLGIMIGKVSIIYFWGFVCKSLLESITDIKTIITVLIMLGISYIVSNLVNKKLDIE